ncbi:MAG: endonuclease III [Bacilli bacterium]
MTNKEQKINDIISFMDELFPAAHCELNYNKDYELVIAVMLSAQTTDKAVNKVSEKLFADYPSLEALKDASEEEIYNDIKNLGLAHNKAKNVKGIASSLISDFDGKVPSDKEALMSLPGVGRKTANVIRAELFAIPEFAVDTHVERVSKRLKLAFLNDNPYQVELKLHKLFPQDRFIKSHHQFIHFGRYFCKAINPSCSLCKLKCYCRYKKENK